MKPHTLPLVLSVLSIAVAVIVYAVSVTGLFWPATPVFDVGLTSTALTFLLLGVFGLLLAKVRSGRPQTAA